MERMVREFLTARQQPRPSKSQRFREAPLHVQHYALLAALADAGMLDALLKQWGSLESRERLASALVSAWVPAVRPSTVRTISKMNLTLRARRSSRPSTK